MELFKIGKKAEAKPSITVPKEYKQELRKYNHTTREYKEAIIRDIIINAGGNKYITNKDFIEKSGLKISSIYAIIHNLTHEGRITRRMEQEGNKKRIYFTWHETPVPMHERTLFTGNSTTVPKNKESSENAIAIAKKVMAHPVIENDKPVGKRVITKQGVVTITKLKPELPPPPMSDEALRQLDVLYFDWVREKSQNVKDGFYQANNEKFAAVAEFRNYISNKIEENKLQHKEYEQ